MKGGLADYENWSEGGTNRTELHIAGGALIGGLGGGGIGSAAAGAAGAGVASAFAGKLNGLADDIGGATGSMTAGNIAANVLAGMGGALVGGGAGAAAASNADLYNRQLHPDERQWAKDNAGKFAQIYQDQTGQTITADQAQQMLLASGYRMVDAAASAGPAPDGNRYATAFISQYGGDMLRATPAEYNSPFLYGNADHSLTPEQRALPGAIANPKVGLAIAGGLVTAGLGPGIVSGLASVSGAPIFSSGGALGSAALASPVGTGAISAGINAGSQYIQNGSINPVDVAGAFATGAAGTFNGAGLIWNMGVNAFGAATTTALNNYLQGKDNSITAAALTNGVLSSFGYGVGKLGEYAIGNSMRPTISNTQNWAATGVWAGSGWNFINPNNLPVIGGTGVGGVGQEPFNKAYDAIKSTMQNKK